MIQIHIYKILHILYHQGSIKFNIYTSDAFYDQNQVPVTTVYYNHQNDLPYDRYPTRFNQNLHEKNQQNFNKFHCPNLVDRELANILSVFPTDGIYRRNKQSHVNKNHLKFTENEIVSVSEESGYLHRI